MNRPSTFLSVIVPVFNEEATLKTILKRILVHLPPDSEVIVVNDGSTDQTAAVLEKVSRSYKLRVFSLPTNRGKGYAVRYGLRRARGRVFLIQDADLEYQPQDFQRLLKPIRDGAAQVVYGSRLVNHPFSWNTLVQIPMPLHYIANTALSIITNLMYGSTLTDMETCYKVFTRQVYRSIRLTKNGFAIEAELTVKILRAGFSIVEIPIETNPRTYQEGKKITWVDGIRAFITLAQYRFESYHWASFGILVLAAGFRFYRFTDRYSLWSDQARDALVGRVSLAQGVLPLIGSFSSAGPFTFGPYWYWYSALMSFIIPTHFGYWIGMGIASLAMVAALLYLGEKIGGPLMSLTAGILGAISFSQLQSSLGSTQHSMVGVIVTFFLLSLYFYLKSGSAIRLFLASFLLGLATNFHYQAIYLIPMLVIAMVVRRPTLVGLVSAAVGIFLPFIPLLVFDMRHDWWNLTRIIDYYRFGQYRIYVPNRWLTYAGLFWPRFWAKTAGGHLIISYILMLGVGLSFLIKLMRRNLDRFLFVMGTGFLAAIVWFRYFRGERYEGYAVYSQPLILLFTAWFLTTMMKKSRVLGLLLLLVVFLGSLSAVWQDRSYRNAYPQLRSMKVALGEMMPGSAYAVYDQEFRTSGCSISLSLLLDDDQQSTSDGQPVGLCQEEYCPQTGTTLMSEDVSAFTCRLVDLRGVPEERLQQEHWVLLSPEEVHRMTVEWWKDMDVGGS